MSELRTVYGSLPEPYRSDLLARIKNRWIYSARASQLFYGSEKYHVMVGGRGSGKTRAGAEWILEKAQEPNQRLLMVARTAVEVRSTLVEGPSGVLAISPKWDMPTYNSSLRKLTWANGTQAFCTSADEPDSLRGVSAHATWFDEPRGDSVIHPRHSGMNSIQYGILATRLGPDPQMLFTGTSQSHKDSFWKDLKEIVDSGSYKFGGERIVFYHSSTYDNDANLSSRFIRQVTHTYDGTSLAGREIHGHL